LGADYGVLWAIVALALVLLIFAIGFYREGR